MVSSTKAILFLATPHRGTHLAELLNRILSVSIFNHRPKQYVAELSNTSRALEDLNEQFRYIAPKLQIISFYETLPTPIGPKKITVLEKNSSILGYPTETSKPLNADHHHVCKYESTQDTNYVSVRNALKTVVSTLRVAGQRLVGAQGKEQLKQLEGLLAIFESPSEDLTFFQKRWTPGTCEWILSNPEYMRWVDGDTGSKVLWLHALPATGKSILSSFIVKNLLETKAMCAYYFFRFGDQTKRSLSACLRSLSFQIAEQLPSFRKTLHEMSNTGVRFEKADARTIWQKVFTSILFKMTFSNTFYWVIDGLDETDSPRLLIELIQSISSSMLPIKVMLVSRRSPELVSAFERLTAAGPIQSLTIEDNEQDIRRYVEQEIDFMHAPPSLKAQVVRKLLERANGNFLWVNLALTEILQCLTPTDIEETLEGLPSGMGELYHRMEISILKSTRPRDQDLARTILTWAACPRRPLTLPELEQALKPEFPVLLDLSFTISQVCGQFVVIDSSKQIVMVHQTAREYLVKSTESALAILPAEAHQKMFAKCMYFLDQSTQRRGSERRKSSHLAADKEPFLRYAATSWPYHLYLNSATSNEPLILITKFLRSMSVLAWISSLAEFGQLKVLVHASRTLNSFVRRRRNYDAGTNPLLHRLQDLELVELWATDLIKILGKFGPNLTIDPSSIYKQIPPFCPRDSMIHKQFGMNWSGLSVNGISSTSWDDSLAKISLGSGSQAITVACSGNRFAVLTVSGQIFLYSTITFEAVHVLRHGERVSAISFSHSCDRFVSSGFRTTKVWSVATGKVVLQIQNPASTRALKITFSADDNSLLIGSADRGIRIAPLNVPEPAWSFIDQRLLREDNSLDRTVTNSPCCVSFSPDATHVAVAYRGFPLSVWSIDPPELISRCRRNPNDPNNLWAPVDRVVWHPYSGEVLGLYLGGYVFKWHPYNGTHQEIYASASIIACSPEGTFFATGDGSGTIKLYGFDHFALVYQLSCENVVNDISFSPDSRRLYDLRGQFCNVWEPNALLRLDDVDEQERDSEVGSELGSLLTAAISEAVAEIRDPITAISIQPRGSYHAVGAESGIISIFNSAKVISPIELFRSASMLTVEHLDWGEDGQHLACAELGGKITVKLVTPPGSDDKWSTKSIFDIKMEVEVGGIQQIMLNTDSTILLVGNRSTATLLSLNAKFDAVSRPLPPQSSASRWIKHPTDPTLLLAFSFAFVRVYRWHDLTQIAVLEIIDAGMKKMQTEDRPPLIRAGRSDDSVADDNEQNVKINRLVATPTGSHILFQYTVTSRGEGRYHQTLVFDTFAFEPGNEVASSPDIATGIAKPIFLPEEIETRVEIPLGILSKNRFIYLDKEFSMCSLRLDARGVDEKAMQEHFFLPRDWLNSDCLELCTLLPDGTFLIPHNGEIVVVKSDVMLEW
jgi:WD40 repeat protein